MDPLKEIGAQLEESSNPKQKTKKRSLLDKLFSLLADLLGFLFWAYILTKVFAFDVDLILVERFAPNLVWLLKFKVFIVLGFLSLLWLIFGSKKFIPWAAYLVFFPIIFTFFELPYFIFKQKSWILAFAFLNAIITFCKTVKFSFISGSIFLIALIVVLFTENHYLIWTSISLVFLLLISTYIYSLVATFKPSSVFRFHSKIFKSIRKHASSSFILEDTLKSLKIEDLDDKQMIKWSTNLQLSVLFNRVCLFTAKKLREYQNSRLNLLNYIFSIFFLFAFTVFSFTIINFGVYKIDPTQFDTASTPTFFMFFYYSFNNLIYNSIPELIPIERVSQVVSMLESTSAFFLIGILIAMIFSVRDKKYTDELAQAIKDIELEGENMESFVRDEFKIDGIEAAMLELNKLQAGLIKIIYKISDSIK